MSSMFEQPDSPTDLPSYEYSVNRRPEKPAARREIVDGDGWLIYDAGAFEQAANETSSSAAAAGRQRKLRPGIAKLGRLVVVNGRDSPDDEPPPFTPTLPSYDGPAYTGHQQLNSGPASPLHSPPRASIVAQRRAALPYASPRPTQAISLQDRTDFSLSHTSFNPNMAYSSSSGSAGSDPGSFYGSYVASAMIPSASSQLYQPPRFTTTSLQSGHNRSQASSLSTPPSPLLNREFSTDRSSAYSRVSDSSVSVGSVNSRSSSARGSDRASNAMLPPPGAAYGLGPSAASARASLGAYSTSSAPGQWAANENQVMRDIYGSR